MQSKYCLPITLPQRQAVTDLIASSADRYQYFEVWLDYLEDAGDHFAEHFVTQLASKYPHRMVFLFRRLQLEPIRMPLKQRLRLLKALGGLPAMVDLDAATEQSELQFVRSGRLALEVIASYHNYELTPPDPTLQGIVHQLLNLGPQVVKIATQCASPADAVRLLQLGLALGDQKHIVLGMGPHGDVTRIFGTLWGNVMVFAPDASGAKTAPGQLTRAQLSAVFQNLDR